jgi:hypothetical protein
MEALIADPTHRRMLETQEARLRSSPSSLVGMAKRISGIINAPSEARLENIGIVQLKSLPVRLLIRRI